MAAVQQLPVPGQPAAARAALPLANPHLASLPVHAQRRRRQRSDRQRLAALPPDVLDAAATAATAAAAASLLTAAWLQRASSAAGGEGDDAADEQQSRGQGEPAAAQAAPPSSRAAIWAAAWKGFAPPQQGQQAEQAAPGGVEAASLQPQAGDDQDAAVASQQESLRQTPVLLLEGIRSGDRRQLLALCLAALEAQVSALPPTAPMALGGQAQWRQLCACLLALASLAAASAWLGYVPAQLLAAAAAQLEATEPGVLHAAGLQAAAAAVRQQAAAAAAAAGGGEERSGAEADVAGSTVDWYCLEEKLQLYSSVLRLLTCTDIEAQQQQQQQQQDAATPGLPPPGAAAASSSSGGGSSGSSTTDVDFVESGQQDDALARQQALALLQQQRRSGQPGGIRGWRATAAGTRSESQLLELAPSVLQDMAVTAGDAVAAAYLADAAAAGPSAAAMASASADAAGDAAAAAVAGAQQQGQPGPDAASSALSTAGSSQTGSVAAAAAAAAGPGSSGSGSSSSGTGTVPLEAGWWPTYLHRQLSSTRQLQRFANAVAVQRWVRRQYQGVADIYEDRMQLWGIAAGGRRLEARAVPMKRTPELGRLSGLRYSASLLLEAVDLAAPLLRSLWRKATAALSWLLVRLVGQAVALVRRGVQQGTQAAAAAAGGGSAREARQRRHQERQQGQQAGQQPNGGGQGNSALWAWQG